MVGRRDTELAARDDFDLLPGGVAIFAHDCLLSLDFGDELRAVRLEEAYPTDEESVMKAFGHRTQQITWNILNTNKLYHFWIIKRFASVFRYLTTR